MIEKNNTLQDPRFRGGFPLVILVRPQMGENIGAVARAMSNFGLSELRLVAPRDGWPNPKASAMASNATDIIEAVQVFSDMASAMQDVQIAFATSARPRDLEKRVLEPDAAMKELATHAAQGARIALVFGPERSGLDSDDLGHCDTLITIPTSGNSSLNIAQSAVVIFYEWLKARGDAPTVTRDFPDIAPHEDWEGLFDQLETYLDLVNYYRVPEKKTVMWQNLRNMLLRARMSSQEIRTVRGLLRSIWEGRTKGKSL